MSKKSLFLFFLSCWTLAGAQNYRPLPTDGKGMWQLEQYGSGFSYNHPWLFYSFMRNDTTANHDTIINSLTYQKLFLYEQNFFNRYIGAYRSENNGKLWFMPQSENTERLIMDISANPGDTVFQVLNTAPIMLTNNPPYYLYIDVIIDSVHTHTAYNRNLRVLYGHPVFGAFLHPIIWVESVGSIWAFFNADANGLTYDATVCASDDDTAWCKITTPIYLYQISLSSDTGSCPAQVYNTVGISDQHSQTSSYLISPNPFSNYIRIENIAGNDFTFELFDLSGRCLLRRKTNTPVLDQIPELGKGAYLLRWKSATDSGTQLMIRE